ncbi:hypothetical protein TraAM80_09203 [Trypanosoma rangeli]|uniref:Uncharacterized protein n=1 Tax=Trypanosoma rangeli TaxID=5698 RepID=A0A3R7N725_TRYRA|nr:uncharacterized protein TraAM80_09203 [Trypanosoma rangeli]RNE97660.1 hypothetical protein TraAM80_09203 [Trypanosoma rangeli]|eukprot:RNE97660.1 hypothetical protein TraAM80_09203 [Trypanosoma rangeli]
MALVSVGTTLSPRHGDGADADDLHLPVVFLDATHPFSLLPRQEDGPCQASVTNYLCLGSITVTRTGIIFSLVLGAQDGCECGPTACDDTAMLEVVVFSDVIEAVTGFRRWVSATSRCTLCYSLELLGRAHCVVFRVDGIRFASPHVSDVSNTDTTVEEVVPPWVRRVTAATGLPVETGLWTCSEGDGAREVDMPHSTFAWRRLQAAGTMRGVGGSRSVQETKMGPDAVEWAMRQQNLLYEALSEHVFLMHEEHQAREDILLSWASLPIRLVSSLSTAAAKARLGTNIAQTSLSLRGRVATVQAETEVRGKDGIGIADEVAQLLAEEETVARMKFEKYAATVRRGGSGSQTSTDC